MLTRLALLALAVALCSCSRPDHRLDQAVKASDDALKQSERNLAYMREMQPIILEKLALTERGVEILKDCANQGEPEWTAYRCTARQRAFLKRESELQREEATIAAKYPTIPGGKP
jgi:hypothetical protein